MAERTLCQECTGGDGAVDDDCDHDARDRSWGTECNWMCPDIVFARFDARILRSGNIRLVDLGFILRSASGEGLRRGGRACAVFFVERGCDLSACVEKG